MALLLAVFMAVCPDLHSQVHWIAKTTHDSGHQCAATLFAKGLVELDLVPDASGGELPPLPPCVSPAGIHPELIAFFLLPGRAPPAA